MQGIIDFLKGIVNFIISVTEFLITIFKDLAFVIKALGQAVVNMPSYLGFLPTTIIALFVGSISIIVVYKILGRD